MNSTTRSGWPSAVLLAALCLLSAAGCTKPAEEPGGEEPAGTPAASHQGHSHGDDDVLFWQREELEHEGWIISLGHHGAQLNAGHETEPAVMITKDGEPVADAAVFVTLLDAEGADVLVEEQATVFEPTTEEEPAHFAQATLLVPADAEEVTLQYRITLPGAAEEFSMSVPVGVERH